MEAVSTGPATLPTPFLGGDGPSISGGGAPVPLATGAVKPVCIATPAEKRPADSQGTTQALHYVTGCPGATSGPATSSPALLRFGPFQCRAGRAGEMVFARSGPRY